MTPWAPPLALVGASALGYASATVVMARLGAGPPSVLAALVAVVLGVAVIAEIAALRHLPIGVVYLTILGLETLLVLAVALWFGQALGLREVVGGLLVLAGAVLLAAPQG